MLNKYLKWLNEDVNEHNKNLKSLISTIIQQRKQKAQRDKDDAESLGFRSNEIERQKIFYRNQTLIIMPLNHFQ